VPYHAIYRRSHSLRAHSQLVEFYQQRFPDRVSKVDGVMSKFAGREHEITKMIQDTVAKERAKGAAGGAAGSAPLQPAIVPQRSPGMGSVDLLDSGPVLAKGGDQPTQVAAHNIMSQFHQPAAFSSPSGQMGMGAMGAMGNNMGGNGMGGNGLGGRR
jgi:hypothetical protein